MATDTLPDTEQTKTLLKEALIELLQERRPEFQEVLLEALEEVAFEKAIQAGRRDEFVSEDKIRAILEE
ncbi:MAG: hypothetical protein ACPW60_01090 [Methylohalobius sp. ZOD2]|nr:hypothetical protein [Methylothermaceae bacterium]